MKRNTKSINAKLIWALSAVVGLPIIFSSTARAQMQVNTDGHALDANNRVGSGGVNENSSPITTATGNEIVTKNVTGGFQFRGKIPYIDPLAFRGLLPGTGVDRFIAGSWNPSQPGGAYGVRGAQPFYGPSNGIAPPPGYVRDASGTFTPVLTPMEQAAQLRLASPIDPSLTPLPKPGELLLPGPVDTSAGGGLVAASPLYGVRQWQMNDQGTWTLGASQTTPGQSTGPLSQDQIIRMRQQLYRSIVPDDTTPTAATNPNPVVPPQMTPDSGTNPTPPGGGNAPLAPLVPGGMQQSPLKPLIPSGTLPITSLRSGPPSVDGSLRPTTPGMTPGSTPGANPQTTPGALPSPDQQSDQYAEMRRRLTAYDSAHPVTPAQSDEQFFQLVRARRQMMLEKKTAPGKSGVVAPPAPGVMPAGPAAVAPVQPSTPAPSTPVPSTSGPLAPAPGLNDPGTAPVQVHSVATGVKGEGLADLLSGAEAMVKAGQYNKAIEAYNKAEQVAPNNPLILIARAEAELGGDYFKAAEADLRAAFGEDKATLMGQYDLDATLGAPRRDAIIAELKKMASKDTANSTSVFLLAFISYSSHDQDKADKLLAEAQRRAGGDDAVIASLQRYWAQGGAPSTQPVDNKP